MSTIRYDGFIGSMLASESILDGTTLLHGPGGCRNTSAGISERYLDRDFAVDDREFFLDRFRIPCTFVDSSDYIYGSADKVDMVLDTLKNSRFTVLLESPGASLIGDRLWDRVFEKGMSDNAVVIGKCYMSEPFSVGYDHVLTEICRKLSDPDAERDPHLVNIVGAPFITRGCPELIDELTGLLGMMGLEVAAGLGSGCTVDEVIGSSKACADVCVMPEYCRELSAFHRDSFGIPTACCPQGAPVGWSAVRSLLTEVGRLTGADPSPALERIDRDEDRIRNRMRNALNLAEKLRGRTYSLECESSMAQAMVGFLGSWLRMAPEAIDAIEEAPSCMRSLKAELDAIGCSGSLGRDIADAYADIMIGPGARVKLLEAQGMCRLGIDASLPSQDQVDLMPKQVLGIAGAHMLLDRIVNAVMVGARIPEERRRRRISRRDRPASRGRPPQPPSGHRRILTWRTPHRRA